MDKKNTIKIHTNLNGAELKISAPSTKQTISATNNRAQYFAEQAMRYRDEAKQYRDNAKLYAEQNSDVTFEYINNIKDSLEYKISTKQDAGSYALKEEIPKNISAFVNDSSYVDKAQLSSVVEELSLPDRTDKLGCFLKTDGVNESWVGINSFQLFDTKLSDHILEGEESLGWALQGTYVSKAIYPDFYTKCIEQKEAGVATETTLSGSTITLYNNPNGHKFYDIADKAIIDIFYNAMGSAWFFGVDTENERIFLPRNKYLTSYVADGAKTVDVYGNGKTISFTDAAGTNVGLIGASNNAPYLRVDAYNKTLPFSSATNPVLNNGRAVGLDPDASKSGITGSLNLQNTSNDLYVYICVGNTTVNEALVDVGQLSSDLQYKADKTEIDGQWGNKALTIIANTSVDANYTNTLDLSDYLPNDGYAYEIMLNCLAQTGGTSGNMIQVIASSSICPAFHLAQCITRTSNTNIVACTVNMPIASDKILNIGCSGTTGTGKMTIYARNYRRIGTNL